MRFPSAKSTSSYGSVFVSRIETVREAAERAGQRIKEVRSEGYEVMEKDDDSPVTLADREASRIIHAELKESKYGYVDEERGVEPGEKGFWLVDPLDGTKEFIDGNDEYTVNIALIQDGEPVLGVVHVPEQRVTYCADGGDAWRETDGGREEVCPDDVDVDDAVVAVSKSHPDDALNDFLSYLGPGAMRGVGSSLKGCHVADGTVNAYPRFQRLYMWDVGAMHAVLEAASCKMTRWNGDSLVYDAEHPRMQPFIAAPPKLHGAIRDSREAWRQSQTH